MRRFRVTLEVVDEYNRYDADGLRREIIAYPNSTLDVDVVDSEAVLIESDEDNERNRRNV